MRNVTDRTRNPFGMTPPCSAYVPGFGDANADFHVVGDHPGVHGGLDDAVPFAGEPWSAAFFDALVRGGLLRDARTGDHLAVDEAHEADDDAADSADAVDALDAAEAADGDQALASDGDGLTDRTGEYPVTVDRTFLSYLHMCLPEGEPSADDYADMDRFFDAELRAIAAHVLLPVGARATEHVLEQYTARARDTEVDMENLHGQEIRGSGWLVISIRDPSEWEAGDADRLVESLQELQRTDYHREADLGRFLPGDEPYLVR
ncbi:uracil-DNA glycosylase [Haloparvum sp. AD34]